MSEALSLAKDCLRAVDARDIKALRALFSPDGVFWDATGTYKGVDAAIGYFQVYADAMPKVSASTISSWAESGDTAFLEVVTSTTHTGVLRTPKGDIPPSGRSVTIPYVIVVKAEAGKLCDVRFYYDQIAFLGQLGLMPQSAAA